MKPLLRTVLAALVVAMVMGLGATPASACRCVDHHTLFQAVAAREVPPELLPRAVYVAEPRLPDPWPGRSFRVVRTLKGPPKHNLRIGVGLIFSGSSCAIQYVTSEVHVVLADADGPPDQFDMCNEIVGDEAVAAAIAAFGPGTVMPWRPDLVYVGQWSVLLGLVLWGVVEAVRWSRREPDA